MASQRVPWKPPTVVPPNNLPFDPANLAQDLQLPPQPGWVAQEQAMRQPVLDQNTRLQEAVQQQEQAQQKPGGLEGIIASPIFQLAIPTALSALAAIYPRTLGPAAGIGMAGFRTVTDLNQQGIQNRRSTVAERVKQMKADLEAAKLRYAIDDSGIGPEEKNAANAYMAAGRNDAAAGVVQAASVRKIRQTQSDEAIAAPMPPGITSQQFTTDYGQATRTVSQTRPTDDGLTGEPGNYFQSLDPIPGETLEAKRRRAIAAMQADRLAQAEKMRPITNPVDPRKQAENEERDKNLVFLAKSIASDRWQDMVNPVRVLSVRADGGWARTTAIRMASELAASEGRTLDPALIDTRFKMIEDYFHGPTSRNLVSLNTAIRHIGGVYDAMQNVTLLDSPVGNQALQRYWETVESSPEFQRYLASIAGPKKEVASFLLNNRALYESDRQEFDRLAAEHISSGAMREVLKEWIHLSVERASSLNEKFRRVFNDDLPDVFDEAAEEAARKVGYPVEEPSVTRRQAGPQQPGAAAAPGAKVKKYNPQTGVLE